MRLVILEDDRDLRELLVEALQSRLNTEVVHVCSTAAEARAFLGWSTVDACLIDWELPGESGGAFATWLQRTFPDVRRVLATSHRPDVERLFPGVFNRTIFKPFSIRELERAIKHPGDGDVRER